MRLTSVADYLRRDYGWTGSDHGFAQVVRNCDASYMLEELVADRELYVVDPASKLWKVPRSQIQGLTATSACELVGSVHGGRPSSVDYDYRHRGQPLQHPDLPSLMVKKEHREKREPLHNYYPLEMVFMFVCSCRDVCSRRRKRFDLITDAWFDEVVYHCPEEQLPELLIDWDTPLPAFNWA